MDEQVLAAMIKWPNVPAAYGWLSLTMRGRYLLQGQTIGNALIEQFIARNYAVDEYGCAYFQNGPQRVFAQCEYAPWVVRYDSAHHLLHDHCGGLIEQPKSLNVDQQGYLSLSFEREGKMHLGLVDSADATALVQALTPDAQEWFEASAASVSKVQLQLGTALVGLSVTYHADQALEQVFGFTRNPIKPV